MFVDPAGSFAELPLPRAAGLHSHLKDQMLQTARAKNLKVRPGGDVEGVNALRILKLSGDEFSSYNVHSLLSHSRLPAQRVAHAEAAAMSWLLDSCGVQLAELHRREPLLLQSERWQLVGEYRARLAKLWTGCVEAATRRLELVQPELPRGKLSSTDPTPARTDEGALAPTPRRASRRRRGVFRAPKWCRAAVRLSAAAARCGQACPAWLHALAATALASPSEKQRVDRGFVRLFLRCCQHQLLLVVKAPYICTSAKTLAIVMERQRAPIRAEDSMPLLIAGRTSLRLVARLGLSNVQLLQGLLAVVFLLHAADGAMLPGIFKALEEGLTGATPVSLGGIVFIEALCHSFAVLVWGVLADRHCKLTLLMYASHGSPGLLRCWEFDRLDGGLLL
eukprot:s126_g14.t1